MREIGCSNFSAAQLEEAAAAAAGRRLRGFAVVENEYSLLEREPEGDDDTHGRRVLATAARLGMAFVPFYPLASGLLSGAYRRGQAHAARLAPGRRRPSGGRGDRRAGRLDAVERLAAFAEARGHTLLELSLSYLAAARAGGLGDRRRDQARPGARQRRRDGRLGARPAGADRGVGVARNAAPRRLMS